MVKIVVGEFIIQYNPETKVITNYESFTEEGKELLLQACLDKLIDLDEYEVEKVTDVEVLDIPCPTPCYYVGAKVNLDGKYVGKIMAVSEKDGVEIAVNDPLTVDEVASCLVEKQHKLYCVSYSKSPSLYKDGAVAC